jgi:hypothetical protein
LQLKILKKGKLNMPSQEADTMFEQILQDVEAEIEESAREFKAFTKRRKIKTPKQLMRILFLYCGLDKVIREIAANFTLTEEKITDTALTKRLKGALLWVKAMLVEMLPNYKAVDGLTIFKRLLVIDATTVSGPGAKQTDYRLHISIDLIGLEIIEVKITDKHSCESLQNFSFQQGDLVIADRAYAHVNKMALMVEAGVNVICRISSHNCPLFSQDQQKFQLLEQLNSQSQQTIRSFPVILKSSSNKKQNKAQQVEGWLHCYRLTAEQANKARRKINDDARRQGRTPKQQTLLLGEWILVFTTVGIEKITAEMIMDLYRLRWQVELVIKRLKSILNLDELRSRYGKSLAQVWLYGKILYALMLERRARRIFGSQWTALDSDRCASWWRIWKVVIDEVKTLIIASAAWDQNRFPQALEVLFERSRRRKLKRIPPSILAAFSDTSLLEVAS